MPALSNYDEAIKHLDAATAQLKAIASGSLVEKQDYGICSVATIREDDELNYYTNYAKQMIEKLKSSVRDGSWASVV